MEADLDKAEVIKAGREELTGEKLLSTEYLGVSYHARIWQSGLQNNQTNHRSGAEMSQKFKGHLDPW